MEAPTYAQRPGTTGPRRPRRPHRAPLVETALRFELDRRPGALPYFEQIRGFVAGAITDGTLQVGVRLPPERDLASHLRVSRSTVTRAYQELVADGLLSAAPSRGTVVAPVAESDLDTSSRRGGWAIGLPPLVRVGADTGLLQEIVSVAGRDGWISFASSAPSEDLIPVAELSAVLNAALERDGARLLGYGPVDGLPELREQITARMQAMEALAPGDRVLVLSGSTQGLALAARVFVEPGDEVVVEAPTYLGTIQTLESAGVRLVGVPVDANGLRVDSLEEVLSRRRIRLMVLQPNFHNPTGVSLSEQRRSQILWLAGRYGVPILEDDAYGSLYFNGPAPRSLKQLDNHGWVTYLSTFSKTLAPGLRVAWMCGPPPVIARMSVIKQYSDLNTNSLGQVLVSGALATGFYDAHLARLRVVVRERMARLVGRLREMPDLLKVDVEPAGGMHVWCRLAVGDAPTAVRLAAQAGVTVLAGGAFYPSGYQGLAGADRLRISLPTAGEAAIETGLSRLEEALRGLPPRSENAAPKLSVFV